MLRLARWWLRDEILKLNDGTAVYYIHDFTGPGYILKSEQRRRLEVYFALYGWVIFGYFAAPNLSISSWLLAYTGEFFGADYVVDVLLLILLLLSFYAIKVSLDRFWDSLDRRNPAHWDDDLKLLAKAADMTKGANALWVPAVLIIGGWAIGFALEIALQRLFFV